jgi:hypothetical protein
MQKQKRIRDKKLTDSYEFKACLVCGKRLSCAAHIQSKGARGDDVPENLLSLCLWHHNEQHNMGIISFAKKYKPVMNYYLAHGWEIIKQGGREKLLRVAT